MGLLWATDGRDRDYFYINEPRISWSCCSLANTNKETIQNQRWVKEKICPIRGGSPDNQSDAKTCDRPRGNSKTTKPTACEVCQGARCSCLKISSAALASAFSACRQKRREGKSGERSGSRDGGAATNNIFAILILSTSDYSFAVCHHVTGEQNKTPAWHRMRREKQAKLSMQKEKRWWERSNNSTLLWVAHSC